MLKNRAAASAEASFDAVSSHSTILSGSGTMKTKNAKGNAAAAIHFRPRKRNPPAEIRQTNENAISDRESSLLPLQIGLESPRH